MKSILLLWLFLFAELSYGETAKDFWLSYQKNPDAHEYIPNNSFAGFAFAKQQIKAPSAEVLIKFPTTAELSQQKKTADQAIRNILQSSDHQKSLTIEFPEGEFEFQEQIRVQRSHTKIRGAGMGKTKLIFKKSLWDIMPSKLEDGRSPYAWSRGLFEISPPSPNEHSFNGWGENPIQAQVIGSAKVGARNLKTEKGKKLRSGFYLLSWDLKNKSVLSYIAGETNEEWLKKAKHWQNRKFLFWPVYITQSGDVDAKSSTVTLAQPLRLPITALDSVTLREMPPYLSNIEVSDLSISTNRTKSTKHLEERGYNAFFIHRVIGGIIHNVSVENVDNGYLLNAAKHVTLKGIRIEGKLSTHHGTFHKYADDCLVEEFQFDAPFIHGLNADLRGSGNVWRAGKLKHGSIDMHRGMQFDLIRTNIEFETNSGASGGDEDAGPMQGRRVVHWNLRVNSNRTHTIFEPKYFPYGALVGIQAKVKLPTSSSFVHTKLIDINKTPSPEDLFLSQVEFRP